MPCRVDLSKSQLVMVSVVQDVHEVGIEGVDAVQLGKVLDDGGQSVVKILLSKFYFFAIELTYPGYLVLLVDNCWRLSLGLRQGYVNKVFG